MPYGVSNTVVPVPQSGTSTTINATSLGRERSKANADGSYHQQICLYVPSALQGSITSGAPYFLDFASTLGQEVIATAPAGNSTSGMARRCLILEEVVGSVNTVPTTGTYGWFAYAGKTKALVDGTTDVAAGSYLKCNSKDHSGALEIDGAGTSRTTASVAIALDAQAADAAVLINVWLLGDNALIA